MHVSRSLEEKMANARLIAAAPDLLEALTDVLPLAESYLNMMPDRHRIHIPKLERALAAIAKAESR
jgi:hypothetical protein